MQISSEAADEEDIKRAKTSPAAAVQHREGTKRLDEVQQVHIEGIELQDKSKKAKKAKSNRMRKDVSNRDHQEKESGAPEQPPATFLGHQNPMMQQLEGKMVGLAREQLEAAHAEEIH